MNPRIYYDPASSAINPWRVRGCNHGKRQCYGNFPTKSAAEVMVRRVIASSPTIETIVVGQKGFTPVYILTSEEYAAYGKAQQKIGRDEVEAKYEHRLHVINGSLGGTTKHHHAAKRGCKKLATQLDLQRDYVRNLYLLAEMA